MVPIDIHRHLLGPNKGCEHNKMLGDAFQSLCTSHLTRVVHAADTPRDEECFNQLIPVSWLMVETIEKWFVAENLFFQIVLLCSLL